MRIWILTMGAVLAMATGAQAATTKTALFAGGCFWCMQPGFDKMPGVVSTTVGYSGGDKSNPTYEEVSSGTTGHFESIQVTYDPAKVKYEALVEHYLENIDPTDLDGQFADKGSQYKTAIFYADAAQKAAAEKARAEVVKKFAPQPVGISILPAKPFYAAEDYHQKYYQKNALHFQAYEYGSGRESGLKRLWDGKTETPQQ